MFTRTYVPTSTRTIWESPHQNLSQTTLSDPANRGKLLCNDTNGEIGFFDYTFLDDVMVFPTMAQFPATGEESKMYLDQATNRVYRWAGGQYFFVPHDVYAKNEVYNKNEAYNKAEVYTKVEADDRHVIRSNTVNDMSGSALNNLSQVHVATAMRSNINGTFFDKAIHCGWNDLVDARIISNKIRLDGSNVDYLQNINMFNHHIEGASEVNTTKLKTNRIENTGGNFLADSSHNLDIIADGYTRSLRIGAGLDREANAGRITHANGRMEIIGIGANPTSARQTHFWDTVTVQNELGAPDLRTYNLQAYNGTISCHTNFNMFNNNITETNNIETQNLNGAPASDICYFRTVNFTSSGAYVQLYTYTAPAGFAICDGFFYTTNGVPLMPGTQVAKVVTDATLVSAFPAANSPTAFQLRVTLRRLIL